MDDLPNKLRQIPGRSLFNRDDVFVVNAAADEIERLRGEIERVSGILEKCMPNPLD